jgi:hypothetical protein
LSAVVTKWTPNTTRNTTAEVGRTRTAKAAIERLIHDCLTDLGFDEHSQHERDAHIKAVSRLFARVLGMQ